MSLTSVAFALALTLCGQISPATTPTRSIKVGDFLVTATRVGPPPLPSSQVPANPLAPTYPPSPEYADDRFHLVAVEVTVKNISERVSQSGLRPQLKVKPDAQYIPYPYKSVKEPNLDQLLPGEESRGGYVLRIRNGTTAVALSFYGHDIDLTGMLEDKSTK